MSKWNQVASGKLTEKDYHKKGGDFLKDGYVTTLNFDNRETEMFFSPTEIELNGKTFPAHFVIYGNENPSALFKAERKASYFQKAKMTEGFNGRLISFKDDNGEYHTHYSISFEPMPSEDKKVKNWSYKITRNEEVHEMYLARKSSGEKAAAQEAKELEDINNDQPF